MRHCMHACVGMLPWESTCRHAPLYACMSRHVIMGVNLHDSEVCAQQTVDVGRRQEAAELAPAPTWRPQLPYLQGHAALEQPCSRQRWLIWLHAQTTSSFVSLWQHSGVIVISWSGLAAPLYETVDAVMHLLLSKCPSMPCTRDTEHAA